ATAGGVGLITAHTRRPELTDLGGGSFYANCGSGGRVVECVRARGGFPPVFVERLRCSWVELEAGADLHAPSGTACVTSRISGGWSASSRAIAYGPFGHRSWL